MTAAAPIEDVNFAEYSCTLMFLDSIASMNTVSTAAVTGRRVL